MTSTTVEPRPFTAHASTDARSVRALRVALLGCGNIGGALARELRERLAQRHAQPLQLCAALVRDSSQAREVPSAFVTTSLEQVAASQPDVVVECMGGISAPAAACEFFLRRGVHVVSANKSMVAATLPALSRAAREGHAQLRFDAAVCAGVPVLEAVARLRSARISAIHGIVNGTCNFILHSMAHAGLQLHEAVAEAITLGYAEPDPTADLSGQDSAEKLCLLAAAAGLGAPLLHEVQTRGISACTTDRTRSAFTSAAVDRAAIQDIRALGQTVRLVACARHTPGGLHLSVSPTVVPAGSTLGLATGTHNVVTVETELAGTVTLSGPGAGARPTVAALMADILACAENRTHWTHDIEVPETAGRSVESTVRGVETTARGADAQAASTSWLLCVASDSSAFDSSAPLTPDTCAELSTQCGATLHGASFLKQRALLQVYASASAIQELAVQLHRRGTAVQILTLAPDVTLRF